MEYDDFNKLYELGEKHGQLLAYKEMMNMIGSLVNMNATDSQIGRALYVLIDSKLNS